MTPQHHIIKETSGTISRLLQDEFKRNGYKRIHIVEQAPKPEAIEGKLPAVSVYLYQVSVDYHGLMGHVAHEVVKVEHEDGTVQEFSRRRRLWIRLEYLISAFAQTPEDEQLLLGLIIRTIMENPALAQENLRGESFEKDFKLSLSMSGRMEEGALSRFWGAMSQPVRPAIQTWTVVPIVPESMEPITRVRKAPQLSYRNLSDPRQQPEMGPRRTGISIRRHIEPERGTR